MPVPVVGGCLPVGREVGKDRITPLEHSRKEMAILT